MSHGIVTPGATFAERSRAALADPELQGALTNLHRRLDTARAVAETSPELKDRASSIRREVLADLDGWLDRLAASLERVGAVVHRASTPEEARSVVVALARERGVSTVVKSKSMATEEIDLADERPSHMITPAIHKTLDTIADVLTTRADGPLPTDREALAAWTHDHLRPAFLRAEMGISGVNFAAADTGTITIVTNEGNCRLCTSWPRTHVAVMPVEKVIPRLVDLATLLPLLTRSATGQAMSNYLSMITGPRRDDEMDGPDELHVVFLDNNRRALVGTAYEDMLACIRCGACLNVCPVYRRVSGHAYGAVYSGPMGKVLTPLLSQGAEGRELPHASSLCGACTEACPVEIPLADLLVRLRADLREPGVLRPAPIATGGSSSPESTGHRLPGEGFATRAAAAPLVPQGAHRKVGLSFAHLSFAHLSFAHLAFATWSRVWASPGGYRATSALGRLTKGRWARRLPGLTGWTRTRDLPLPAARSFRERWAERTNDPETRPCWLPGR